MGDCSGRFIFGARPKVDFRRMYGAIWAFQGGVAPPPQGGGTRPAEKSDGERLLLAILHARRQGAKASRIP